MRLLLILFLLPLLGFSVTPSWAQNPGAAVYEVTDVGADVTADSAVHARDQALFAAQRTAFQELLQRLGADPAGASKLTDEDIAVLVQSFEVQNERTSSVRYIGTFTVQFRPNAVRNFLGLHNIYYSDAPSKPVVVLPVSVSGGHPILWEERTRWRTAWETGAHDNGIVPVIVPPGGLDDIAVLSTEEATAGKDSSVKGIIDKYQAGSAMVAILNGDLSKAGGPITIELWRYDADGDVSKTSPVTLTLTVPTDSKTSVDSVLLDGVKQARVQLEKDWKKEVRENSPGGDSGDQTTENPAASGPTTHLPVIVPIQTLAEWAQIKQRLDHVPSITRAEIVTLARGTTNIEIEFHGTIPELQSVLTGQGLSLLQDKTSGAWTLLPVSPGGTF